MYVNSVTQNILLMLQSKQKSEYTVFLLGIPVIYVTYSVIWKINNVVPSNCANVSKRLLSTAEMLEERLSSVCSLLPINSTVNFTYSMDGSLVFIITFVMFFILRLFLGHETKTSLSVKDRSIINDT